MVASVLVLLLSAPGVAGVEPTLAHGWSAWRWTVDDGLPMNHVTAVAIDDAGLVWVATREGLARFDGRSFVVRGPATDPGLATARFIDVLITDGSVWGLTEGGGLYLDEDGRFEPVELGELGLAVDLVATSRGPLLLATQGVARLTSQGHEPVPIDPPGPWLRQLVELPEGIHLVSQGGTLHHLDLPAAALSLISDDVHPTGPAAGELRHPHGDRLARVGDDVVQILDEEGELRVLDGDRRVYAVGEPARLLHEAEGGLVVASATAIWTVEAEDAARGGDH